MTIGGALGCTDDVPLGALPLEPEDSCGVTTIVDGPISATFIAFHGDTLYWMGGEHSLTKLPLDGRAPVDLSESVGPVRPFAIAADAGHVYWTGSGPEGGVWKMPTDGGVPTLIVESVARPHTLELRDANLYWIERTDSSSVKGRVMRAPVGGSAWKVLGFLPVQSMPADITVDAANVYWTDVMGAVTQAPIDGGDAITLATGQDAPIGIAVDDENVYWTTWGCQGSTCSSLTGAVMKTPIGGGALTTLAANQPPGGGIAVHAGYVYWASGQTSWAGFGGADYDGPGRLMRVPTVGGTPEEIDVSDSTRAMSPHEIVATPAGIFWTESGPRDGAVKRFKDCSQKGP